MNSSLTSQLPRLIRVVFGPFLLLFLFTMSPVLAADKPTNAPPHWPSLHEVLDKWSNVPVAAIERAAESGDLTAQHYLGYCYSEGLRFPQDTQKGMAWYERAGRAGYMPSFNNLGLLYQEGKGVPQDYEKMLHYYHLAAAGGAARAQVNLSYIYRNGIGVQRDLVEAGKWLEKAAESGDAAMQCEVGFDYEHPTYDETKPRWINMPEAVRWYRLAAAQNHAASQYYLGLCYIKGNGVEKDEEQGLNLIRQAADQNYTRALFELAELYGLGIGEPRNPQDQPMQLLRRAMQSEPKDGRAYSAIIYRCEHGLGTDCDLIAAVQWYCRGALAGVDGYSLGDKANISVAICGSLGGFTGDSEHPLISLRLPDIGGPKMRAVLSLFLQAARINDPQTLKQIGEMYVTGNGAPKSAVKAWPWLALAAQKGEMSAAAKMAKIETNMTRNEVNDARKMLPDLVQELNAVASALGAVPGFQDNYPNGKNP